MSAFPFDKLPYELIFNIIRRLDARKLCRIFSVCKFFSSFGEDENLWKRLCVANGTPHLLHPGEAIDLAFFFSLMKLSYKMDQLQRSSLSKSRVIFLANAFKSKVVIEQHQQQLRLQVRAEIFVVRQLKHPNIVQLLCTSDSSVLGQITDPPTSPKMTEYMPYSLKALRFGHGGTTHSLSTVLRFAKGLAAGFYYLLENSAVIPADFLLLTGRSILLDEKANVKVLVRDVTARGSMSADFLPPEMLLGAVPSTPDATLTYLYGLFLATFCTPSNVAFLRPSTANLTTFIPTSFPGELFTFVLRCLNEDPSLRPSMSMIVSLIDKLQPLVISSDVKVRIPEPRQRSLSDNGTPDRNIRKSAEAGPGKKQLKPGKQGPGAVVCEITEASSDEVKAFKELGEGATYKAYYGFYNSLPVTLRVLKDVTGEKAEKRFKSHIERWLRVKPHNGFVRFLASCQTPPMIITQFGQWTLPQFLSSTSAGTFLNFDPHLNVINVSRRLKVLLNVAEALRYLHDNMCRPFKHLHPTKIVIDERFHARLCDAPADVIDVSLPILWQSAVYLPPEALGNLVAPAYQYSFPQMNSAEELSWDAFAFGMLMWRVLANVDPAEFVCPRTQTDTEILTSILFEHRRPPLARLDTPLLATLIASCWTSDPATRPPFKAIYFRLCAAIPLECSEPSK